MEELNYKTGTLVEFRSRPWVVQQSIDTDLLVLKPLGGTDAETIGLYKPVYGHALKDAVKPYNFRKPSKEDIGKNSYPGAARILFNACRLSFRDIAGPFQCLGRLSFEPRPYQMVPLILALKHETIRLLISDDVGIGKTLESLLIAKELLDRKEIQRFAVICLPHLCEQWQNEIRDKFGLEAEIIRSSTISRLEKNMRANQNIFHDIPFQIISIDYIKSSDRKPMFLQHCPEFIIVDEAHTCAKPKGANKSQQLRHSLLSDLAKTDRHIVMLTATPHSGNTEEFQSLIGLLKPEFASYTLEDAKQREALSHYFIQRRRADVKPYVGDDVIFPDRVPFDGKYSLSPQYHALLMDIIEYVRYGVKLAKQLEKRKQRYIYWDLLALIRGVMSSPEAGISMLQNKITKRDNDSNNSESSDTEKVYTFNDAMKDGFYGEDIVPDSYEESSSSEKNKFRGFIASLRAIIDKGQDTKVKEAEKYIEFALNSGNNPIVFCQYIQTAEYVKAYAEKQLKANKKFKNVSIEVITSRLTDEDRKMKIDELSKTERHVLICTDCLSEGVNLQNGFDAIIHYDLPWNPNRVEQRNGRIDRFGQTSHEVMICTMFDEVQNPVDKIVMKVLYRKQEQIRKSLGIYIPIADNDSSIMESIMEEIIVLQPERQVKQLELNFEFDEKEAIKEHDIRMQRAAEVEKKSHTYFAHNTKAMNPTRLVESLNEAKKVIGDIYDTRDFIVSELKNASINIKTDESPLCYSFQMAELSESLKVYFRRAVDKKGTIRISFASPTPKGYMYIGRNHIFVEDLSRGVVNDTINGGPLAACRAMVMTTEQVDKLTTVILVRVRSVISEQKQPDHQMVGEEIIFFGYRGRIENHELISDDECRHLFLDAKAAGDVDITTQRMRYQRSLEWVNDENALREHTDDIALERANKLVQAFTQYRTYVVATEFQVVRPVLPVDVMACYVFLPKIN